MDLSDIQCNGQGASGDHCCYQAGKRCLYLVENQAGRRYACGLLIKYGSWEAMNESPEYEPIGKHWTRPHRRMPMASNWKLYYHDRSTYSSEDGSWVAAPAWGVMACVVRDDTVDYTRESNDFYIMTPWGEGQPWGADAWGVLDLLIHNGVIAPHIPISDIPPTKMIENGIKFGRSIRSADWIEVQAWIHDDPDFGPKSTRWPHERP